MIPQAIADQLPALAAYMKADHDKSFPTLDYNITFEEGGKFIRIVQNSSGGHRSAAGFIAKVDVSTKQGSVQAGDLLKTAGWKAPTLNFPRGSIFHLDAAIANGNVRWTGIG